MRKLFLFLCVGVFLFGLSLNASATPLDPPEKTISAAFIDVGAAAFAQTFVGQMVVNDIGISGSPLGPLVLEPSGLMSLTVSRHSSSLYSISATYVPHYKTPLSVLFDFPLSAITWVMGDADGPSSSVEIDFFAEDGSLVSSVEQSLIKGYNSYSYYGFGTFSGFTIYNVKDTNGLRYQNFDYAPVPEPSTWVLVGSSLAGLVIFRRKCQV